VNYKSTVLYDIITGKRMIFKTQTEASKFLGKNTSYIANTIRDGRMILGNYKIGG
jgi:hypothetical protein